MELEHTWIKLDFQSLIDNFGAATIDGLTWGGIYALIAVGYTLVYGVLGLINFAHADFFTVGAYALLLVLTLFGFSAFPNEMPVFFALGAILVAMIAAMIAAAAAALIVERAAYKPLRMRGAPKLAFLITAIGASFTIQYLFFLHSSNPEPALVIIPRAELFQIGDAVITNHNLATIIMALLVMVAVEQFIRRSRLGRGIRAVAQDPGTAALMGVNRERVIMLTFIIGGLLAGFATIFYVLRVPSGVQFNAGLILGLKAFTAAVLGGIGNVRGALIGGFLIGLIGNWGQLILGSQQWSEVVIFSMLLLVLMFRPSGILGQVLGRSRA